MLDDQKAFIDAAALLVDEREENFPGERFMAFATFFAWAAVPHRPRTVEYIQHVAAARLYRLAERDLFDTGRYTRADFLSGIEERFLNPHIVTRVLLQVFDREVADIEIDRFEAQIASDIVRFFLQVAEQEPDLPKPSMNRAMRFVEENGFDFFDGPISGTKVKEVWANCARTAPILAADWHLGTTFSSRFPQSPSYHRGYGRSLQPGVMKHLLGSARYIQSRCTELMRDESLRKIDFPVWPDFIPEVPVSYGQISDAERKRIRDYRVKP